MGSGCEKSRAISVRRYIDCSSMWTRQAAVISTVCLLKTRPEVDALSGTPTVNTGGVMNFAVFEGFIRGSQKAKMPQGAVWKISGK
ncbi:hypothetical protein HWV62_41024 [Athelia sp. TMB]|nr:hypothetical protein HWV62_41024 [Athelia sp. TMB]